MKTIVFILVTLFVTTVNAAVYKCTDADGKIEFSDKPCEDADSKPMYLPNNTFTSTTTVDGASVDASGQKSPSASDAAKTAETTKRAGMANERRFIREGMTAADVRSRIGSPDSQEAGIDCGWTTANGEKLWRTGCECWIYDPAVGDSQTRTDVCFQDGRVSAINRKVVR